MLSKRFDSRKVEGKGFLIFWKIKNGLVQKKTKEGPFALLSSFASIKNFIHFSARL